MQSDHEKCRIHPSEYLNHTFWAAGVSKPQHDPCCLISLDEVVLGSQASRFDQAKSNKLWLLHTSDMTPPNKCDMHPVT